MLYFFRFLTSFQQRYYLPLFDVNLSFIYSLEVQSKLVSTMVELVKILLARCTRFPSVTAFLFVAGLEMI